MGGIGGKGGRDSGPPPDAGGAHKFRSAGTAHMRGGQAGVHWERKGQSGI